MACSDVIEAAGPSICSSNGIEHSRRKHFTVSCRTIFTVLSFFCLFECYALRVNLSVAITAMAKTPNTTSVNGNITHSEEECPTSEQVQVSTAQYTWDSEIQFQILGSFYYGYFSTLFISGILAERFGGKIIILIGLLIASTTTIISPFVTHAGGWKALLVTRIIAGMGTGVSFPCMHNLLSYWAPPLKRSRMCTIIYAGCHVGTVVIQPISSMLCHYVNWESVFYFTGGLGVLWSIMWSFLVYLSPATHPRITAEEREAIETAIGERTKVKVTLQKMKCMFTSLPVYATSATHFAFCWGFYCFVSGLPSYLTQVFKAPVLWAGFIACIPYLACWGVMVASGFIADHWIKTQTMTRTNVRKFFNITGLIGSGVFGILAGFCSCNVYAAMFCVCMSICFGGMTWAGWSVNHLDLAPAYAGTLMSITNTLATISGFASGGVVGKLTLGKPVQSAWRNVFYVAMAVDVAGSLFYLVFGSGEVQPWASPEFN